MLYQVYTAVDVPNKPLTFSLVQTELSRKQANALAWRLRQEKRSGTVVAVYAGNSVKSCHNRV